MRYSRPPKLLASTLWLAWGVACSPPAGPGRDATVFYASGADLQSINPLVAVHPLAKAVQKHLLFQTLATYDVRLQPVPRLASWEWEDGRRALVFHLRSDVRWHDGVPTRAADVVWTLTMARHPEVAYPRARDLATVEQMALVDSLTVRVRFDHVQPTFPDVFTDLAILPAHRFEGVPPQEIRRAAFNTAPVGNGPFAFVEYRPNQRWVFRRFEDFPVSLGRPAIERFVIAVVDEPSTKLAALTSGEVDFAGITAAHAGFVRRDPALRVFDYPMIFSYALVWNVRREPFDDVRVRRALTMALDRQAIVAAALYGFGTPADGPVPPEHPWFEPVAGVGHGVVAARSLLEAAGWETGSDGIRRRRGRRLAFQLLTVGSGDNVLEQMIQAQLRSVGAAVTIRQLELTSFLATAQGEARNFDALVTGIPGDLALGHVAAMFDGVTPGPLAYPGYRSAQFDAAMEAVRGAETEDALEAAWRTAQRILDGEFPTTWLYHARGVQGANNRIRSEPPDLRGELAGVTEWEIEKGPRRR
ncbi:MAG: ABC transporter substrate-binding protein [Gemmatimonadota bacterium]|nr:ABC transporter substrate-binding protein [Gemmatimonadota bacterium]MDH3366251.1 ABC transporter substrate-binding protein [Gemmatimonadota bacterium]MDH3476790.1 ABC transporter substrate-binding protein [Gemmatimonadota bacterium]MDH3570816.1 ABC transporter substrate-binding protein [Gemmatimonadota bacterium]MDH5549583.1 ABC transporter substrate-binding protein [Gemmatimonadota bacterium]